VSTAVDESRVKYRIAAWLEELARHPIAFKLHAGTQFALDRADELAIDWLDARRTHFRIVMRQILFALGLQVVSGTVLLGLGGWLVISGQLSLGQLVAAELIVAMIVGSFSKLGKHMESFYDLLAAMDKLGHLFDLPTEPHNRLFHLQEASPAEISVRGLTYRYHTEDVLNNTSFRVQPGSKVAIVGRAGSGKSTLIDLLCGLRHPHAGHVELDGIDLRELRPDSLREHMAAARGVEVFRGSVAENVHLNRAHISSWDVRQALEAVGLLDEVLRFPEGLNATLQTNGPPLSQSQALRLMLARAIVGRPRLLLIDATLDSLDDESLKVTLRSLCAPSTPWTLLVTTGRREVIAACQRMITLIPVPRAAGSQLSTT
jgi:ABC-type bacteriocin/lantibiotic exporter with double-glycine peptidase domain